MIDPHHVEQLKHALSCHDVATHYNVRIRRAQGTQWQAHCFNHQAHAHGDRNPSLSLGPTHFQCFAAQCDIHGDVFDLIAQLEGLDPTHDFPALIQIASELSGLWPPQGPSSRVMRPRPVRLTPQDKGPFDGFFPSPGYAPLDLDTLTRRQDVMRQVWEIVARAPLSPESECWLEGRGIRPEVAWERGGRDWARSSKALSSYLHTLGAPDLVAAGFAHEKEEGVLKMWAGLEAIEPDSWARGLCLPVHHPRWPQAPLAWRLRLHTSWERADGKALKALAQHAGEPALPSLPLGLVPRDSGLRSQGEAPIVILCEGEPDWLSVADVVDTMGAELPCPVYPVGVVTMSSGIPYEFMPMLAKARGILCMFDQGPVRGGLSGGERVVEKIRGGLMHLMSISSPGAGFDEVYDSIDTRLIVALRPDEEDVNDLHKQGKLAGVLEQLLEELP